MKTASSSLAPPLWLRRILGPPEATGRVIGEEKRRDASTNWPKLPRVAASPVGAISRGFRSGLAPVGGRSGAARPPLGFGRFFSEPAGLGFGLASLIFELLRPFSGSFPPPILEAATPPGAVRPCRCSRAGRGLGRSTPTRWQP